MIFFSISEKKMYGLGLDEFYFEIQKNCISFVGNMFMVYDSIIESINRSLK